MEKKINDQNFKNEVLQSTIPVVVNFCVPWCRPCCMFASVTEKLSDEYDGRVKFCKLNVDENPEVSQRYGVENVPLLVFFGDGKQIDKVLGTVPEEIIRPKVDALL